ncbi:metallophosphoesterase [Neisseria lisongii]|uniref:Metallophosphoesterase n=1 Tax=Neisseria lisongii TaxID=2912188 RepID=A0AAW5AMK5_9NEIS|nr:metallophosphoesterase [Neisseria lisongii]MCF7529158.1 metallophosphoesterase [Neisseria lisongii]
MSTYLYRQTLPDTPLDIVGDVHGEFSAFQALLRRLGYQDDGTHPQGRKLVFVGDLCDRGPDSPAMLDWFKQAHSQGKAFAVLGNHELNLLVDDPKDGSGWFFDSRATQDAANYAPWHTLPDSEKAGLKIWLAELPLILERSDLRIVHAAWLPDMLTRLDETAGMGLVEQYRLFDRQLTETLQNADWYGDYLHEQQYFAPLAENPDIPPPPMPATARYDLARSLAHPIRALTSGIERSAKQPFFAGGRWRETCRCAWWDDYRDNIPVIIGHYWRSRLPTSSAVAAERRLLPAAADEWHGAKRNVFCVDFSIGASWRMRKFPEKYRRKPFALAALRWPEQVLVFHDGQMMATR